MHQRVLRLGRRVAIGMAGGLLVVAGIILGPLPIVPGFPLILLGLGILSLEFERPRVWLVMLKARGRTAARRLFGRSGDGE
jgi:hypothetical protein